MSGKFNILSYLEFLFEIVMFRLLHFSSTVFILLSSCCLSSAQLKETEEETRCLKINDDPTINLIAAAAKDIVYQQLVCLFKTAAQPADLDANHPAQHFPDKWHELSTGQLEENEEKLIVKNGKQIVIPKAARKELLRELHRGHRGISKSY